MEPDLLEVESEPELPAQPVAVELELAVEVQLEREPLPRSRKQLTSTVRRSPTLQPTPKTTSATKCQSSATKSKNLQNADLGELAENAKQYARQKPGQALLISAAAGLLLGLIIRGRR